MNENKYFDEETVEKVREYEKTDRAKAEEKKIFEQMHKKEIMAEAAKSAIDPNELLDTYIGKNSNKITGKNFNWSAFFFGSFYAFFRKMYVYGFLLMVFTSTVSIYITRALGGDRRTTDPMMVLLAAAAFYIIVDVIVGLTFNGMYLNNCMGKINEIRDRYKNDKERIIEACKRQGGTNLLVAIILSLVLSGLATTIATIISKIG